MVVRAQITCPAQDVDEEFVIVFLVSDENQSHYLQTNIDTYGGDIDDEVGAQTKAYIGLSLSLLIVYCIWLQRRCSMMLFAVHCCRQQIVCLRLVYQGNSGLLYCTLQFVGQCPGQTPPPATCRSFHISSGNCWCRCTERRKTLP